MNTKEDPLVRLDDYLRGQRPDELELDYEQDLFARALDDRAPELVFRAQLGSTLRDMHQRGSLEIWPSAAEVARLEASGLRIRHFALDPQQPTFPDLSGDFDLLVVRIALDLVGLTQLDVDVCSPQGQVLKTMVDVGFDAEAGAIYTCCEAELARTAARHPTISRFWGTDASGRRLLAEIAMITQDSL
jgi:hypothetical protein